MDSISLTEFKKLLPTLTIEEIKRSKSFVVTAHDESLFTFIVPTTDYIKETTKNLVLLSNSVGGEELNDIIVSREEVKTTPKKRKKRKRRAKSHAAV